MGENSSYKYEDVLNGTTDYIEQLFKTVPDEYKVDIAINLVYQSALFGSYNHAEALGIMDWARHRYIQVTDKGDEII
jgi:hypothetical protein